MILGRNKQYLLLTYYILFISLASPQVPCDPFENGSTPEIADQARANGEKNPNSCLCSSPCTVDKVSELVRLYYIKRRDESYRELDVKNPMSSKLFNYKGHVKFLVHGYTERGTAGWLPPTGKRLSKIFDGYIILVDYGAISNCSADRSVFEIIPSVGYFVADVIRNFNFDPQKIELVGHSFGAHISGYTGASLNGVIQKITALDPAKRRFDELNIGLNKSCAQFVQVLHTNPNGLGTALLRGDADFYANNRSELQPGCTITECGHSKSFYYYYASLFRQNKFIGGDCLLQDKWKSSTSIFGQFNDQKSGMFCFQTTSCFPYAIQIKQKCMKSLKSNKC